MKVLFWLRKNAGNGTAVPIYVRVSHNKVRAQRSTGRKCKPEDWHYETQRVAGNAATNARLSEIELAICRAAQDLGGQGRDYTAEEVLDRALLSDKACAIREELATLKELVQAMTEGSRRGYLPRVDNLLRYLAEYPGQAQLVRREFVKSHLAQLVQWLVAKGYHANYINKHLSMLVYLDRKLGKQADCARMIQSHRLKPVRTFKPYLTLNELQLLAKHKFRSKRLQQVRDLFLLQALTGLSYCDLKRFGETLEVTVDIEGRPWLVDARKKTQELFQLPLPPQAMAIINRYERLPLISNTRYNCYIKELAEIVGIQKELSSHAARRTAAMCWLNEGLSMESVAAMLGHSSTRETQEVYAKVLPRRIIRESERYFERLQQVFG